MNENQNTQWSKKDDMLLITSRHKGIDFQVKQLGRSRKAIKSRLSLLETNGTIDDTYILSSSDYWETAELRKKYVGMIDWCFHIIENYELSIDDMQLLSLAFDNKELMEEEG